MGQTKKSYKNADHLARYLALKNRRSHFATRRETMLFVLYPKRFWDVFERDTKLIDSPWRRSVRQRSLKQRHAVEEKSDGKRDAIWLPIDVCRMCYVVVTTDEFFLLGFPKRAEIDNIPDTNDCVSRQCIVIEPVMLRHDPTIKLNFLTFTKINLAAITPTKPPGFRFDQKFSHMKLSLCKERGKRRKER